jgi:hypothetical protein
MSKRDYEVGYGKPPSHTRFQPGHSGNPKGRPRGVKNLATDLQEELEQKILVTEANQTHEVTKQRAMLKTLIAKSLKGDTRAAGVLINLILGFEQSRVSSQENAELSEDDQELLQAYRDKLLDEMQSTTSGDQ